MLEKAHEHFCNGEYIDCIKELAGIHTTDAHKLLLEAYIKANVSDLAVYTAIQLLNNFANIGTEEERKEYASVMRMIHANPVIQAGFRVLMEYGKAYSFKTEKPLDEYVNSILTPDVISKLTELNTANTFVLPVIWPIAYGDMIVFNQLIKDMKAETKANIVVIIPLNRKELKELFAFNTDIDLLIDITLIPEGEKNRNQSIGLINGNVLNVSVQEALICHIITTYLLHTTVYKWRYLPYLFNIPCVAEKRMWETRAKYWVENKKELPKLIEQDGPKTDSIVVHFREGKYGDTEARDINPNYAQELINRIKEAYPDYDILRLMDKNMTHLDGVTECFIETNSVNDQIYIIQQAKLFIGCHSAPQMLAVACSDTPVICICYTCQETTTSMDENIPRVSYEPIGKQVKKVFYNKMFDKDRNELIPTQYNHLRAGIEPPNLDEVMVAIKEVLE